MRVFEVLLRLVRRGLIWLLLGYWAVFVGYTIEKWMVGGAAAAAAWYRHIEAMSRPWGEWKEWTWWGFLARQVMILAVTLALIYWERRSSRAGAPAER